MKREVLRLIGKIQIKEKKKEKKVEAVNKNFMLYNFKKDQDAL